MRSASALALLQALRRVFDHAQVGVLGNVDVGIEQSQLLLDLEIVLQRREGLSEARAKEIAEAVAERSRDPRDAVKVGRLAGETAELKPILDEVLPAPLVEPPHTVSEAVARKIKGR